MNLTAEAWVALLLGVFGFVSTAGMLIMNLSVRGAVRAQETHFEVRAGKIELAIVNARAEGTKETSEVKVELAMIRTKLAEEHVAMYQQIMASIDKNYMNRQAGESMHEANTKRLDTIDSRLTSIEERLPA